MKASKILHLNLLVLLHNNVKLEGGNISNFNDKNSVKFFICDITKDLTNYAIINDQGEEIRIIRIYPYLDASKIRSEYNDGKQTLRIEKNSLKVVFVFYPKDPDSYYLVEKNMLGYFKLNEDWVSEPKENYFFEFNTPPIIRWEKQLVMKELSAENAQKNIKNAIISNMKLFVKKVILTQE